MNNALLLLLLSLLPLLPGLVCPTAPPPYPATLPPPVIDSTTLEAFMRDGRMIEGVRLSWHTPGSDTLAVASYSIYRKVNGDSDYVRIQHQRPSAFTTYIDRLDRIGEFTAQVTLVSYRIFAVDTLGRLSDTSRADTIGLAPQPYFEPSRVPDLNWSVIGNGFGYHTWATVWDSGGTVLWESPRPPHPVYSQENDIRHFRLMIPDSIALPLSGHLWWGVRVSHVTGSGFSIGSLRIEPLENN